MPERKSNTLYQWVKAVFFGFLLYFVIRTFLFSSYVVEGESMQPALKDGDRLIVNKADYRFHHINRFDVIVFHGIHRKDYVKRVIGVPGDSVSFENDQLYINSKKYAEPYLSKNSDQLIGQKFTGDFSIKEITGRKKVPLNHLFIMGDNRLNSMDSRHFGFVPIENVVGKVSFRYWPFNEITNNFKDTASGSEGNAN